MAPGLAWKACLKKTGVRLELLTDPDMLLMFERGGSHKRSIDTHLQIISIWGISTILVENRATFNILTPTIFMIGRCRSRFQLANSNGLK